MQLFDGFGSKSAKPLWAFFGDLFLVGADGADDFLSGDTLQVSATAAPSAATMLRDPPVTNAT
jgi:hypothetical protein